MTINISLHREISGRKAKNTRKCRGECFFPGGRPTWKIRFQPKSTWWAWNQITEVEKWNISWNLTKILCWKLFVIGTCIFKSNLAANPMSISILWAALLVRLGLPQWLSGKESTCNAGVRGSIPGSGRSPKGGHGNPFQYSCMENSTDSGVWWVALQSVGSQRVRHDWETELLKSYCWQSSYTNNTYW